MAGRPGAEAFAIRRTGARSRRGSSSRLHNYASRRKPDSGPPAGPIEPSGATEAPRGADLPNFPPHSWRFRAIFGLSATFGAIARRGPPLREGARGGPAGGRWGVPPAHPPFALAAAGGTRALHILCADGARRRLRTGSARPDGGSRGRIFGPGGDLPPVAGELKSEEGRAALRAIAEQYEAQASARPRAGGKPRG